jgi:AcrR family transcriptional regulator
VVYIKATERREQLVAAARQVMMREGVGGTTLRAVATEADVPLGTLHYVFPSKEQLLRAVIEDVMEEIAGLLAKTADTGSGLENALRQGVEDYWSRLVIGQSESHLMQHELIIYALRTPGLENLARWQFERYSRTVAAWCQEAATSAGESCAVPFDTLGRVLVAQTIGLVLQYVSDPDETRTAHDVQIIIGLIIHLAGVRRPGARPLPAARKQSDGAI